MRCHEGSTESSVPGLLFCSAKRCSLARSTYRIRNMTRVWLAVISLTFGSSKYEEPYTIIYSHWLSMNYVLYFLAPHRKWHCTAVWENPIKIGGRAWIVVVLSFSSQRANFCLFFGHLSLFLLFLWQAVLVLKMLDQGGGCASENITKT